MADENAVLQIKAISMRILDARAPSDEENKGGGLFLGMIVGIAEGVRTNVAMDKTGETVERDVITGSFTAVKPDGTKIRSACLYLPSTFHPSMCDRLAPRDPVSGVRKSDGVVIEFAIEIYAIKDSNASGRTYVLKPIHENTGGVDNTDPSLALANKILAKHQLGSGKVAQIAAEKTKAA